VIRFPARSIPPVRFFWSLTVYNLDTELVANHYNKYSVGSNSKTLHFNKDGSLDIYLQPTPPAGHQSNWLPTPPNTTFLIALRMYGPKERVLNASYQYPTIKRVS
jgi:hypothetical protein